jgi:hypothetical protein
MDGAFLLLVLFLVFCCVGCARGFLLCGFLQCGLLEGVPKVPLAGGMGTLDMLGSNFSWKLILMGICLIDGVAG